MDPHENPHSPRFEGLPIWRCPSCQRITITCKECGNTACNGGGCSVCGPIFESFHRCKTYPTQYLTKEEQVVANKIEQLYRLIPESLNMGHAEINWQALIAARRISRYACELFAKEIGETA